MNEALVKKLSNCLISEENKIKCYCFIIRRPAVVAFSHTCNQLSLVYTDKHTAIQTNCRMCFACSL